ncbi:hypothetical protein HanRHA438_Chr12g0567781 [Helianthus annuus]|nr:hypothetical protein HanRHA438_Chr12g0567781 [Helianthus annuus]
MKEIELLGLSGLPGLVPGPVSLARVQCVPLGMIDVFITFTCRVLLVIQPVPLRFKH